MMFMYLTYLKKIKLSELEEISAKHINIGKKFNKNEKNLCLFYNTQIGKIFEKIIDKAKISYQNSDISVLDHFTDVNKMVQIGSGAYREQIDYKLTRYACYLIAQNGDSRKKVIALAQTYFAVQTRKQEITEKEYSSLTEDEKRFYQRNLTKKEETIHLIKLQKMLE